MMIQSLDNLLNDLKSKKGLLENNIYSLDDLDPKDMPLAIYEYVISNLEEVIAAEKVLGKGSTHGK